MRRSWLLLAVGVMVAVLGASALACGDDEEGTADKEAQLCADLEKLDAALQSIGDLSRDSTVDEARTAISDVADAFNAARESAADVAEARVDDLVAAYDSYQTEAQSISDAATLAEAWEQLVQAADVVEQAEQALLSGLDCE